MKYFVILPTLLLLLSRITEGQNVQMFTEFPPSSALPHTKTKTGKVRKKNGIKKDKNQPHPQLTKSTGGSEDSPSPPNPDDPSSSSSNYESTYVPPHPPDLDPFEGARLVEGTFRIFEKTAKLTADALRIVGDTTAAVGGSGIKMTGSAVKSLGNSLEATADVAMERESNSRLAHATRRVAGHGVSVMATFIKGVGESFILAGQATESVTSGTAGVAEDTVRVFEELFATFADHVNKNDGRGFKGKTTVVMGGEERGADEGEGVKQPSPDYVSFSSDENSFSTSTHSFFSLSRSNMKESIILLSSLLKAWILQTLSDSQEDVAGVPSVIPHIATAFVISFFLSLWLRGRAAGRMRTQVEEEHVLLRMEEERIRKGMITENNGTQNDNENQPTPFNTPVRQARKDTQQTIHHHHHHHHNSDPGSPPYIASVVAEKIDTPPTTPANSEIRTLNDAKGLLIINRRKGRSAVRKMLSLIFSPALISLFAHFTVFLFVARTVYVQSNQIKRAAETKGFRDSISHLTQKAGTGAFRYESAIWANNLLEKVWRVPGPSIDYVNKTGGYMPEYEMSDYVRRSITRRTKDDEGERRRKKDQMGFVEVKTGGNNKHHRAGGKKRDHYRQDEGDGGFEPLMYGGLEPYLATTISSIVASTLEDLAKHPDSTAYLELYSFTLGSKPPLIRGLRIAPADNRTMLEASFDVDFVSSDLEIILKLKLSSSDYAMLPTTMISVTDLDTRIPLRVAFEPSFGYPFSEPLEISVLGDCRDIGFKVLPLSKSSGMQGVDLNSLPLLSSWIKEGLQSSLAALRSPNFIRFDLAKYLTYSTWSACQELSSCSVGGKGAEGNPGAEVGGVMLLFEGGEDRQGEAWDGGGRGGEGMEDGNGKGGRTDLENHLGMAGLEKLTRIIEVEMLGIGGSREGEGEREEERKGILWRRRRKRWAATRQRKIKNPVVVMLGAIRGMIAKAFKNKGQ